MTDPWIVETFDIQGHFSMPKAKSFFLKNMFILRMLPFIILEYFDTTSFEQQIFHVFLFKLAFDI